jgi:hypothetical protein
MPSFSKPRGNRAVAAGLIAAGLVLVLAVPAPAWAGKLSWLDEVVQEVVLEAKAGGRAAVRGSDGASAGVRGTGRLFAREADEGLEAVVRRYDDLARLGRRVDQPSEALLRAKFARLVPHDPDAVRTFATLAPAEKRLVVEMSETAQRLARRYPDQAETLIRRLGTEGLSAVRVYGDDVAEVLAREGPESLGILRKTGRGGWAFFTEQVLPHKKKLLAAGVFAAFLADPDRFVDYAGRATEYAVREFARAGVHLAGAVSGGVARGIEAATAGTLAAHGLDSALGRYLGMALAAIVAVLAAMVILGLPVGRLLRPLTWPVRTVINKTRVGRAA